MKKRLYKMMLPAIFGLLITFLFQLIDTYFIGELGPEPLTAIGFVFPIYLFSINIFIGLSVGIGAKVGQAYGKEDYNEVKEVATIGIVISVVLSVGIVALVHSYRMGIYELLGASKDVGLLIDAYMSPLLKGMPFILVSMNMIAVLRGMGKGIIPELVMALGGILNLILDYILIFGTNHIEAMGIRGAAIATVISWILIFTVIVIILINNKLLTYRLSAFKRLLKGVLSISLPAMLINLIMPLSIFFVTRIFASFSGVAVAAFGIVTKVESLLLTFVMALSMVLVPIMAQSYGAENREEMDQIVVISGKISTYWCIGLYILIIFFNEAIGRIFTDDHSVVEIISFYLLIVGASYIHLSINTVTLSLLNAVGASKKSLHLTMFKYILILIPLVLIASRISIIAVLLALSLTNIIGGITAGKVYRQWLIEGGSSLNEKSIFSGIFKSLKRLVIR